MKPVHASREPHCDAIDLATKLYKKFSNLLEPRLLQVDRELQILKNTKIV